ncbi:MAG TPA: peptide-methionine (R)-S-oxide reductase MsrB [Salinimicrobium sp.]|nr:peptide-methionine (R)-S-oxide reductase MsrB [Salinimicrobium sp.]
MKKTIIILFAVLAMGCQGKAQEKNIDFPLEKTEAEWKKELSAQEFRILRKAGTERPFSSELLEVKESGVFVCAADGTELFKTKYKFNSGTGWPSFDRPITNAVMLLQDGYRTEVVCATCGGHLGHVFNDGPRETTGKRYCMNGDAMNFVPALK